MEYTKFRGQIDFEDVKELFRLEGRWVESMSSLCAIFTES